MPRNDLATRLNSVPLFADLSRSELQQIGKVTTELRLAPGEVIIRQGDIARDMFVVADGSLEVTRDDAHVAIVDAGGFVGETGLLTGNRRNATVAASSDAVVFHLDGRALDHVLDRAPRIGVKMLRALSRRHASRTDTRDGYDRPTPAGARP